MHEVAKQLAKICDKPHLEPIFIDARPGDVYSLHADTALAHQVLGFKANITFEEGLNRYLAWFKNTYENISLLLEKDTINWKLANDCK